MVVEMKVPSVGESVTEVTIASWVKKDGDFVEMDEIICELESDKATFELPAEASGILRIVAAEEETLEIGALICKIEESEKASTSEPKPAEITEAPVKQETGPADTEIKATGETIEVQVPSVGESITEVTLSSWSKSNGDFVEMDEIICELESDKATFELPSPSQYSSEQW
jgi:2-oxoglutarate dehydrogenase E2 component (dihydrolipoamide succinyltransferase)